MEVHRNWWLLPKREWKNTLFCQTSRKGNLGHAAWKMLGQVFPELPKHSFRESQRSLRSPHWSSYRIPIIQVERNDEVNYWKKNQRSLLVSLLGDSEWFWLFRVSFIKLTIKNWISFESCLLLSQVYWCRREPPGQDSKPLGYKDLERRLVLWVKKVD